MNIKELLLAGKTESEILAAYDYSCLMADLPANLKAALKKVSMGLIKDDVLYIPEDEPEKYGREDEFHITVQYGLTETNPDAFKEYLKPVKIKLDSIGKFEQDKYDVIKVSIASKDLAAMHKKISENFENFDEHPNYEPHITLAYVKKGSCDDLVGKDVQDNFDNEEFEIKDFKFTTPEEEKFKLAALFKVRIDKLITAKMSNEKILEELFKIKQDLATFNDVKEKEGLWSVNTEKRVDKLIKNFQSIKASDNPYEAEYVPLRKVGQKDEIYRVSERKIKVGDMVRIKPKDFKKTGHADLTKGKVIKIENGVATIERADGHTREAKVEDLVMASIKADEDEVEVTQEMVMALLDKVKRSIAARQLHNEWAFRDSIKEYTSWGFYKGGQMATLDPQTAKDVFNQLYEAVKTGKIRQENDLEKIYEDMEHWAHVYSSIKAFKYKATWTGYGAGMTNYPNQTTEFGSNYDMDAGDEEYEKVLTQAQNAAKRSFGTDAVHVKKVEKVNASIKAARNPFITDNEEEVVLDEIRDGKKVGERKLPRYAVWEYAKQGKDKYEVTECSNDLEMLKKKYNVLDEDIYYVRPGKMVRVKDNTEANMKEQIKALMLEGHTDEEIKQIMARFKGWQILSWDGSRLDVSVEFLFADAVGRTNKRFYLEDQGNPKARALYVQMAEEVNKTISKMMKENKQLEMTSNDWNTQNSLAEKDSIKIKVKSTVPQDDRDKIGSAIEKKYEPLFVAIVKKYYDDILEAYEQDKEDKKGASRQRSSEKQKLKREEIKKQGAPERESEAEEKARLDANPEMTNRIVEKMLSSEELSSHIEDFNNLKRSMGLSDRDTMESIAESMLDGGVAVDKEESKFISQNFAALRSLLTKKLVRQYL